MCGPVAELREDAMTATQRVELASLSKDDLIDRLDEAQAVLGDAMCYLSGIDTERAEKLTARIEAVLGKLAHN